ncbi:MAG: rRNA pseudouridine synthase [Clostridia bacterium]|nr:rRNA pseudouridine synthase [Clostridia bacterium]
MRIDKLLSEIGLCTRREAAKIAKSGGILIDGIPVRDVSKHIDPEKSRIVLQGREVFYQRYTYVMLNKPEGYVSATDDKSLPYVTELLPEELRRRELFPVGRLDRDTVGLMILTNNGQLAHSLLSPKHHVEKEYYFTAAEPLRKGAEQTFENGVTLADGYECKPAELRLDEGRQSGIIVLTEGKYHQIKRMIASQNNRVTSLERISFGGITLDRSLQRGEWRFLSEKEIEILEKQG